MPSRPTKTGGLDLSPDNCKRISALLEEGKEVLAICKDCGVDTAEQQGQLEALSALYDKICAINKREGIK